MFERCLLIKKIITTNVELLDFNVGLCKQHGKLTQNTKCDTLKRNEISTFAMPIKNIQNRYNECIIYRWQNDLV